MGTSLWSLEKNMKPYPLLIALLLLSSCGKYPEPVNSAEQIKNTPAETTMLSIRSLDIRQYKDLTKFHQVTRIDMSNPRGGFITDGHLTEMVKYLDSEVKDINLAGNSNVTDQGVKALLRGYPLAYLKLDGTAITDESLQAVRTHPQMKGLNISGCEMISTAALRECLVSGTLDLGFSIAHLSPAEWDALAREKWRAGQFTIIVQGHPPFTADLTKMLKDKASQGCFITVCKEVGGKVLCESL